MKQLCQWFDERPRQVLGCVSVGAVALLAFGMYLQHVVGLEPCPMCIVQRYALILVALLAVLGALVPNRAAVAWGAGLILVTALGGAFTAARQSWLQWYPPEVFSCGRDFYGMIESFPLKRAIPMIFKGSGDCTAVDWTFFGLSIANWSFLNFLLIAALSLAMLLRRR